MKNGLLKAFSFILALSLLLTSVSIAAIAVDYTKLEITDGSVELDLTNDGTVTVSVVAKDAIAFFGMEGNLSTTEQGETNYFTLTGITSDCVSFDESLWNFVDVESGDFIWVEDSFTSPAKAEAGASVITATYKVAKDTPDGEYKIRFNSVVFTDETGDPDETETVYEATVTVTHKCKVEACDGQDEGCEEDGFKPYYECVRCGKYYSDAEATDLIEDLDAWKAADGKIPAVGHKDDDKNHYCDNGCGASIGEHVDANKDHYCDYGCSRMIAMEECVDDDKDHKCDYGGDACEIVFGRHRDNDEDHFCEYCGGAVTDCSDSLNKTDAVLNTCETAGNSEYYTCTVCGKYYSDADAENEIEKDSWILPALGHDWGEAVYTDNGDGTHTASYTCDNDSEHTNSDEPAAHVYEDGVCVCGAVEPATGSLKGDIDLDGDVDSDDLTLLARHVGGIEEITNDVALKNADTNGDGEVNSDDLTKHARYVGGIISSWDQD